MGKGELIILIIIKRENSLGKQLKIMQISELLILYADKRKSNNNTKKKPVGLLRLRSKN